MMENKENNIVSVQMTEEQREAFAQFQKEQERKAAAEKAKKMRDEYASLVDKEVREAIPNLISLSGSIATAKKSVYENFKTIIALKEELFRLRKGEDLDVKSHTFTNAKGDMRITLGVYQIDNYRDTAEEGIAIVKEYISGLARDAESESLVKMVMKLLSKDAKGTLKASRVIQLRRLADETKDERFIEGVRIIEEAYAPVASKTYVKAEIKGENGEWKNIPLGMTES